MVVQELLSAKNSKVVTVRPSTTLVEAAQALTTHRIGALVVTDDAGRLLGIVSERDLTKAIGQYLTGLFDRHVADVMSRAVVTCSPDDSVAEVLYLMNSNRIRHIPVLDREDLMGIISIRDVTENWLELLERENQQLRGAVGADVVRSA
jgi:CBS domain-containing protein